MTSLVSREKHKCLLRPTWHATSTYHIETTIFRFYINRQRTPHLETAGFSFFPAASSPTPRPPSPSHSFLRLEKLCFTGNNSTDLFSIPFHQAYRPGAYYFEVLECFRRLLLTGCLVFILPNSAGQAAVACVLAVLTVAVFALVNPYSDSKDHRAYTLGALAIFLTMFMGLVVKVSSARCGGVVGVRPEGLEKLE